MSEQDEAARVAAELLPCPFCGSADIDESAWASRVKHGPGCSSCGATAESNEAWNRRIPRPMPQNEALADDLC